MSSKSLFEFLVKAAALTPAERSKATALLVARLRKERGKN